ncbi:phosphate ABC transporter permease subunit PstC [Prosthecobacter sp.]|uniref:phosphate ABC transporter permease subunit PstC n=1 Tax=Prosthecobacter sp. TaxID=1965333 RepID=UPI001D8D7D5A|nr:phosphate ABC transporter permease subunit PstC [Prosthecobacter sp.]MCB1275464.1 phosphate ABC transporter permease subunit PstC [Prosthecobacter sp.]
MASVPPPPNDPPPTLGSRLLRKERRVVAGLDPQQLIKYFFGANSSIAIIVLVLIMAFLLREGAGFLTTYRHELEVYRQAGLEFCDLADRPLQHQRVLANALRRALSIEMDPLTKSARERRDAAFLLKASVEEKTSASRADLEHALEQTPPPAADSLVHLREVVKQKTTAAAAAAEYPDLFTSAEKSRLQNELSELSPEVSDLPPFLQSLIAEYSTQDQAARSKFAGIISTGELFEEATDPVVEVLDELKAHATETKEQATEYFTLKAGRQQLLDAAATATDPERKAALLAEAEASQSDGVNFGERIESILMRREELISKLQEYCTALEAAFKEMPEQSTTAEATALVSEVRHAIPGHLGEIHQAVENLKNWKWDAPVAFYRSLGAFFFGTEWITNSSWQDFFGFVPLLAGSVVISIIAVLIATPVSVVAAIYTNQFASDREKEIIKPVIEFIQAIPSVVLGFIGISLVGNLIKDFSEISWLQWIPGFPIQERLNMFNAGCLLAFMAVPTMFSLSEDALNNVPRAYIDASDALGATKLQTVFRVIVPAGISGILSAILLGLGRVVGETMVVLLVAGNRIAVPDFSAGLGVVFQPAHTLTGIIAQELGEVSRGSSHWQALFMVGIVLFGISLLVNWCARAVARRFEPHKA